MNNLNDICDVITCGVAKRPEYVECGVPFLSSKNVKADRFILDDYNYITKDDFEKLTKNNKPEKDDILYTRVGSFGEAAVIDFDWDFAIFVSLTLIKPKKDRVLPRYLMHYLNSPRIRHLAESSTSGIGVQNLNVKAVREFPIDLPPLATQKKIAAILDAADAYRQKTKALIGKYDELTQSLFLEMFGDPVTNEKGWEKKKFEKFTRKYNQGVNTTTEKINYTDDGTFPIIRAGEVGRGSLDFSSVVWVDEENESRIKESCKPQYGDVLYANIGANLGTACLVDTHEEFGIAWNVFRIQLKDNVNRVFFVHQLNSEWTRRFVWSKVKTATVPFISGKQIAALDFVNPPADLQNQFAERVKEIEGQKAKAQESLAKAEELFASLLQRAFKGELIK